MSARCECRNRGRVFEKATSEPARSRLILLERIGSPACSTKRWLLNVVFHSRRSKFITSVFLRGRGCPCDAKRASIPCVPFRVLVDYDLANIQPIYLSAAAGPSGSRTVFRRDMVTQKKAPQENKDRLLLCAHVASAC
jgi:hypothetical protein